MTNIRPFTTDDLTVPGEKHGTAPEVAEANRREREARTDAWFSADFWLKVGREVAKLGTWDPVQVRDEYRAAVVRPVSPVAYDDHGDPRLVAMELVGGWRGVLGDRDAERRARLAELDAQRAALESEIESRPRLSPDRPLRAMVGRWDGTLLGRIVRSGDTIDLGACHIKRGKVATLREQGILEPHPDFPTELDVAQSLNGVAASVVPQRDATPATPVVSSFAETEVPVMVADVPVPATVPAASADTETPEDARRRKDADRKKRYRERKKAERDATRDTATDVDASRDIVHADTTADVVMRAMRILEDDPELTPREAMDMARHEMASGGARVFRATN